MTRFLAYNRRFLVLTAVLALMAGMLLAQAGLVAAIHTNCENESAIEDAGAYYIVHGTKGIDNIDCTASNKPVEIRGNSGDDTLTGSVYADWLLGGWGNDTLNGGDGADSLYGGWGVDTLNGDGGTEVTCLGGRNLDVDGGTCDGNFDQGLTY